MYTIFTVVTPDAVKLSLGCHLQSGSWSRISKQYGNSPNSQLREGFRFQGGLRKRYKDVLKSRMKAAGLEPANTHTQASNHHFPLILGVSFSAQDSNLSNCNPPLPPPLSRHFYIIGFCFGCRMFFLTQIQLLAWPSRLVHCRPKSL